ncbi:hypothetical protein L484_023911 [Morus notabilis]|uniref:Alpha-ketoglutarate-dependent dioxygenase AlkB-like domain-containing protein n=1 Tax=Morus notabilis TaxID=981085 RepID=W9RDM0_9ROSA|nr:hypothetical protein L484_023911 [Morus notabilis]
MEFRRYIDGDWRHTKATLSTDMTTENPVNNSNFLRKAIHLPPRSMLLLSGEARHAWNHHIPHHKIDMVNDTVIRRGSRRVSFTFRRRDEVLGFATEADATRSWVSPRRLGCVTRLGWSWDVDGRWVGHLMLATKAGEVWVSRGGGRRGSSA